MLNIVLPIAGRGARFSNAGYSVPKPIIPVHGMPMIELVLRNVRPACPHRVAFLALEDHLVGTGLRAILEQAAPDAAIIPVRKVTEGAACTALLGRAFMDSNEPLMLVNSDQVVDIDINAYLASLDNHDADGLIMTMWADDPKWSFVNLASNGLVTRVVEKEVVSNDATVGIYNFRRGRDFVQAADRMIEKGLRVRGEFYVAPVYNEMIEWGARVVAHRVGAVGKGMYGLGTPEDLQDFLKRPVSRELVERYRAL